MPDIDPDLPPETEAGQATQPEHNANRMAGFSALVTMCLATEVVVFAITDHLPMPVRAALHVAILGEYALFAYLVAQD